MHPSLSSRVRLALAGSILALASCSSGGSAIDSPDPAEVASTGGTGTHDWTRTNPGGGGTVAAVGATADGTLLTASDLSGVYVSHDDGASWAPLGSTQGLNNTHTSALGVHPSDGDTFFVGTGWGIYKTTDAGEHFTQTLDNGYIEGLSFPAADEAIGYAAHHEDWDTVGEVLRSDDGGDSWHAVEGEDLPDLRIVKVLAHPADADTVYALGGKSRWGCSVADLYRSSDGGAHWTQIGAELGPILDMDVDPNDPDTVLASSFENNGCAPSQQMEDYLVDDENAGALYRSSDGGETWKQIGELTGIVSVGAEASTIRLYNLLFPYDWNDEAGTWLTDDGGDSWEQVGRVGDWSTGWSQNQYFSYTPSFNGLNKTVSKDLFRPERAYASFGQWSWATFDGGVTFDMNSTREVSPGHWQSTGMDNINGHGLAVSAADPDVIYAGGYDLGLWTSVDRGLSWRRTLPDYRDFGDYVWAEGEGSNVTALVADPLAAGTVWSVFHREGFGNGDEFGGGTNSALYRSDDFGERWRQFSGGLPDARFFYGLTLSPHGEAGGRAMVMTIEGDVWRSPDDGETWAMVLEDGGLKFTGIDSADPDLMYAGGENGLWRSEDGGDSWAEVGLAEMKGDLVGNFLPTEAGWEGVFDVIADPSVADRVYVVGYGVDKGLWRSDDRGDTWSKLYTNDYARGVAVSAADPDLVYVTSSDAYHSGGADFAGSDGIHYSTDGGETWLSANDGMAWNYAGRIRIAPGDDPYVIVWSPGTGVQMSPLVS